MPLIGTAHLRVKLSEYVSIRLSVAAQVPHILRRSNLFNLAKILSVVSAPSSNLVFTSWGAIFLKELKILASSEPHPGDGGT